jgi:GGDEF domain-containing protein
VTLLVVEPAAEPNAWVAQGRLANWLRSRLRVVDIPGSFGNGRYVVLMPETSIAAARSVVARLRREINCAQTGLSSFPDDGATFEELYGVARDRLGEAAEVAA